jgi:hypothetical protein
LEKLGEEMERRREGGKSGMKFEFRCEKALVLHGTEDKILLPACGERLSG